MFMIVVHHGIVHGLDLTSLEYFRLPDIVMSRSTLFLSFALNSLCICAVNCFVFISGFYGIRNIKNKAINVICLLILYSIILNILPELYYNYDIIDLHSFRFISNTPYWFILDYLFLLIFVPFINKSFEVFNKTYLRNALISVVAISIYFGWLWGNKENANGYTLLQFIMMYSLGRWFKMNDFNLSVPNSIFLYLVPALINAVFMCCAYNHELLTWTWKFTYYNNPVVILSSIGFFYIFKNKFYCSKAINYIASSVLAIYLIQSSKLIEGIYYPLVRNLAETNSSLGIIMGIMKYSVIIVMLSLIIDLIRRQILDLFKYIFYGVKSKFYKLF